MKYVFKVCNHGLVVYLFFRIQNEPNQNTSNLNIWFIVVFGTLCIRIRIQNEYKCKKECNFINFKINCITNLLSFLKHDTLSFHIRLIL